jgi:hypothetical protein
MAVSAGTRKFVEHFDRAQIFTTTPGTHGWTIKDTSAAGAPTYLCITEDGGAAKLTLAATSEAEILTLYQSDVLALDLARLQRVWFIAKVAAIDSVTGLVFGVADAQNDTLDSVAINAWFKIDGTVSTSAVVIETDDGVTDNDDNTTGGITLAATYKTFEIDFTGGVSNVRFYADKQPVGSETFSLAGITAGQNVQPFVQLQKASGTGVPSITISQIGWEYSWSYGS